MTAVANAKGTTKAAREVATSSTVATTALNTQTSATQAAAAANQRLSASHENILAANRALANASRTFATAQEAVVGASSNAAAAQIRYTRAAAAARAAQEAALTVGTKSSALQRTLAQQLVASTAAFEAEALAALKSARAQGAYSAALVKNAGLQKAGITATTRTAAARAQYQAAISANIAADRAWRVAIIAGDKAQLQSAATLFARTAGVQKSANVALQASIAEDVRTAAIRAAAAAEAQAAKATSARTANIVRGTAVQALSFAGLRGAVLGAQPAFIAGVVAAVAFAKAIQSAASLESELAVFRVTAGATGDEMERVAANAKALGADLTLPAVTAGDAAQAMTELAKAGLSVNDSIAGARGVLQLATAAQITNAEATELAANALNAYGLAGDQAVHVADVLANAANSAQGSIVDFGQALAQSSAVARQVGLSLEDTTAILTLFARNGLRGSDAGTALRTSLIRLIAPTDKARGIIDDLGLRIRDLNGNVRADVFAQFGKATADLSPAVRDAAAAMIFGQDALRAVAIGAREGSAGLRSAQADIAQTGTAAEVAGARMEGLAGAARGLGSNLDTLGVTIGNAVLPAMTGLTKGLSSLVGGFNTGLEATGRFNTGLEDLAVSIVDHSPVFQKVADFFGFLDRIEFDPSTFDPGEIFNLNAAGPATFEQTVAGVQNLGTTAEKQREILAGMFIPAIQSAREWKASLEAANQPTAEADKLIKRLLSQFDLVKQGISFDPEAEIATPLQQALASAERLLARFGEESPQAAGIKRTIADLNAAIHTIDFAGPARESGTMINTIQAQFNNLDWSRPARESGGFADFVEADLGRVQDLLREAQANAKHLDPTDPLAPAARKSIQGIVEELKKLGPAGAAALKEAGAILRQAFKVNVTDGLLAAASLGVAQAARAGADAQVAALRDLEAVQQRAVARAQSRLTAAGGLDAAKGGKKLAVERVGELEAAVAAAASTAERIEGIQDQVVSDAKADQAETERKADEAQDARTKADQAFLDALQPRRDRIDRQTQRAAGTEGLRDNVNAARALKQRLLREIEIIKASNIDTKTKAEEIKRRADELIGVRQTITKARQDVADARKKIAQDRADLLTERLGKAITLAGLRENRNAELAAIDEAIKNAKFRVKNYKKLGSNLQDEQIALETLINQRDELKNQVDDARRGTSAFDLLKQFTDTFRDVGGNLVDINNPFAGPSGFTNIIEPFLVRQPASVELRPDQRFPGKAADNVLVGPITDLAAAVRENTAAQRGNRTAGTSGAVGTYDYFAGPLSDRFNASQRQKRQQEANNG